MLETCVRAAAEVEGTPTGGFRARCQLDRRPRNTPPPVLLECTPGDLLGVPEDQNAAFAHPVLSVERVPLAVEESLESGGVLEGTDHREA
jgi:hypothetical protein